MRCGRLVRRPSIKAVSGHSESDECYEPCCSFFIFRQFEFAPVDDESGETDGHEGRKGELDEEDEEKVGDEHRNQPDGGFSGAHSVAEEAREKHRADEEIGGTDESDISDGDGEIFDCGAPDTRDAKAEIADDFGIFGGNLGLRGERREDQEGIESGKEDCNGEKHTFLPDEDADEDAEPKGPEEHAELHAISEEESGERRERLDLAKDDKCSGMEKNSSEEKNPCGLGFPLV
ncbi:hypothetical protein CCB80_15085 [Armatimonadetes bacterium Uphvl-Ar1]|nr:hypothetical protein CCB80_15085 [Armatimonadetes bacterium Uphvl-Ar1]